MIFFFKLLDNCDIEEKFLNFFLDLEKYCGIYVFVNYYYIFILQSQLTARQKNIFKTKYIYIS